MKTSRLIALGYTSFLLFVVGCINATTAQTMAGGQLHTLSLCMDGTVSAWGANFAGQLGNGSILSSSSPVAVAGLQDIIAIGSGRNHSMALKSDGTLWVWGENDYGALGNGDKIDSNFPIQVPGLSSIVAMDGSHHSIALKSDSTVWTWGYNAWGQIGNGTSSNTPTLVPIKVAGLTSVIAVEAAFERSMALKKDGTVWAWGTGLYGGLGNGQNIYLFTPTQVPNLTEVIQIASSDLASYALKANGTVWAWGYNEHGALGDGTYINKNNPIQIPGLSDIISIDDGSHFAVFLKKDGTVWTTGYNSLGQLGTGSQINNSNTVVQVTALSNIVAIEAGTFQCFATKNDGTVWAWGWNNNGQLGNSNAMQFNAPIQVMGICSAGSGLSVSSFSPASGPVGTTVTLTGTNFSTTPANNTVKFNGTVATVTASTATTIAAAVPAGATSGKITVTVGGNTATSTTNFTVTAPSSPTITGFTPSSGPVGITITITGTNFSATPGNNTVSFNGTAATVTASTTTSITTKVPVAATTGKITVAVGGNTATSSTNFNVQQTIVITTQPANVAVCTGDIATISAAATGADNLSYQWQYSPDGVVAFADIDDSNKYSGVTTSNLSINTNGNFGIGRYRCNVSGHFADPVATNDVELTLLTTECAPQITIAPMVTKQGGVVTLDLKPLITTISVLDLNSIAVEAGPASGAVATVQNGVLIVDYQGLLFSGTEPITISACNINGICSQQEFILEVVADIIVYNAVSANGDDKNPIFRLEFIDAQEATKTNTVVIYNRWGDEVFSVSDYDNKTRVFAGYTKGGQRLPSGVYFYKITLPLQGKTLTGFLSLR